MPFTIDTSTPFGERADRRLRDEKLAWLTTTSADCTPQPVPVWFLWDRPASFLIYSRPDTAKLRNIAERPRVHRHQHEIVLAGIVKPQGLGQLGGG